MQKVPMTADGYTDLQTELKQLKTIERHAVIKAIAEAREHGDLSENAEYHAARDKQSFTEGRIIELEDKIARSVRGASEATIARQAELRMDLEKHEYTLTAAITKNKRPGQREGRDEIDFELWGATGTLVPLGETDLPVQYREQLDRQAQERRQNMSLPKSEMHDVPLDPALDDYYQAPQVEEAWDDSGVL